MNQKFYDRIMPKKDTDRIANSGEPDYTSSLGTV